MASTYSPNLRLELIGTGEQQGSWGTTTNTNLGTLLEQAIGGYTSVAVTDGADTTLTTSNGASDQSRNMVINLTGSLSASRNVICPAIQKVYIVKNATTGGFAVTFKVSGQTGVSIPNGATYVIYVNGTDAVLATGSVAASQSNTFTANQIIEVTDNTNAALRVTQLGTGDALRVEDSSNPDSTPFVIGATGNVGIGTATPVSDLDIGINGNAAGGNILLGGKTNAATKYASVVGSHYANATSPEGVAIVTGDFGNGNNNVSMGGGLGELNSATLLRFYTGANSTTKTGTERFRVDNVGNVLVTSSGGLGYGAGSGGAVTQGTSRTTGVTLNKTNGAITMFSAAGSTTAATFTVTNSTVAETDTIILSQKSGTNLYNLMVTAVGTGSFNITFRTTGGTATDAPVINFAVIKAVTS